MDTVVHMLTLAVAANADGRATFTPPDSGETWEIEKVTLTPNVDSTANGTNYVTLRPYKGSTALAAAQDTSSTGLTQNTAVDFPVTATGADKLITQANPMHFRVTKAGTGVLVNATVSVQFRRARV